MEKLELGVIEEEEKQPKKNYAYIAFVVLIYWTVSISAILLNKLVFSSFHNDATVFITWLQTIVAVFGCIIAGYVGQKYELLSFFPLIEFNYQTAIKVMPLTILFTLMLVFNNLCLKYVQVTFYQIARSLGIPFTVLFLYFLLNEHTSYKVMSSCLIILIGYIIGIQGEIKFSLIGTLFGVSSCIFSTLYFIYTKQTLKFVASSWELMYYNNVNALVILPCIFIIFGELGRANFSDFYSYSFITVIIFSGILGFYVGLASYFQIQATGPLTHNVSGNVKACIQTLLGYYLFGDILSIRSIFGISLTIFGSIFYSYFKLSEKRPNEK